MIAYIIESSIIWFALLLFYYLFLKSETFFSFNRYYLLLSLLAGLILPLLSIEFFDLLGNSEKLIGVSLDQISYNGNNIENGLMVNTVESTLPWWMMAMITIYSIGFCLFLLRFSRSIFIIFEIYQKGEKQKFKKHTQIWTNTKYGPFSFFNLMFIPAEFKNIKKLAIIIAHEEKHIAEKHSIDLVFLELLKIIFWFNPVLIEYKKSLVQAHEYVADQQSLKLIEKKKYSQLLISQKEVALNFALANNFQNSIIKNRIIMMYQTKSKRKSLYKYFLAIPLFLMLFLVFSCKEEVSSESKMDNVEVTTEKEDPVDDVFKVVENMPAFPGCDSEIDRVAIQDCSKKKLVEYIYSNLKYPQAAKEKGVEGTVVCQFVVLTDGSLDAIKIIREIGEGCGDEVKRVVESMNNMESKWSPGSQQGKKVKVMYSLPVKFKLD